MTEPDEPDIDEPIENVYEVSLEASGEAGPGPGQTEDDVPAQGEE
jgi:hypothetical protein